VLALVILGAACTDASATLANHNEPASAPPASIAVTANGAADEPPSTTSTTRPFVPTILCFEEAPPPYGRTEAPYEFDPDFYTHYCSASGVFIVGSSATPIEALEAAAQVVDRMFGHDPQLVGTIIRGNHAVILTGPGETPQDLPEWEYEVGRTNTPDPSIPGFASSGGGLAYAVAPADDAMCAVPRSEHGRYGTPDWGSVLVHELAHLTEEALGLTGLDPLFEVGQRSGSWDPRHYAMTNAREYWAEVVQVYLGQYEQRQRGLRQPITRAELREDDPAAFDLAASIFGGSTLVHYWCDMYDGPVVPLPTVGDAVVAD
jgi:hypothetical protein